MRGHSPHVYPDNQTDVARFSSRPKRSPNTAQPTMAGVSFLPTALARLCCFHLYCPFPSHLSIQCQLYERLDLGPCHRLRHARPRRQAKRQAIRDRRRENHIITHTNRSHHLGPSSRPRPPRSSSGLGLSSMDRILDGVGPPVNWRRREAAYACHDIIQDAAPRLCASLTGTIGV